jgi:hypothetical protein
LTVSLQDALCERVIMTSDYGGGALLRDTALPFTGSHPAAARRRVP